MPDSAPWGHHMPQAQPELGFGFPTFLCDLRDFLASLAVKRSKAFDRKERKDNTKIAESDLSCDSEQE
jgi:hypothetical protein